MELRRRATVGKLRPEARVWRIMCGSLALIDGLSWLLVRDLGAVTSYDWALEIAPQRWWAIGFLAVAMSCTYATIGERRRWPWTDGVTRASVGAYGVGCGTVGLSILFTRGISGGALSGAAKWWLVCIITGVLFGLPTLTDELRSREL